MRTGLAARAGLRAGFTLVELLVVIAVIAILASLLLRALTRAKLKGQSAVCTGNIRQMGLSLISTIDEKEKGEFLTNEGEWIWNYCLPTKGSICPTAPVKTTGDALGGVFAAWRTIWGPTAEADWRASSYTFNGWFGIPFEGKPGSEFSRHRNGFHAEGDVSFSSRTPVIADGLFPITTPSATNLPPDNLKGYLRGVDMTVVAVPRHGSRPGAFPAEHPPTEKLPGAVNVFFFDGHVESVKLEGLWGLYWHKNYVPPEKRPGLL